jgi:RES domain
VSKKKKPPKSDLFTKSSEAEKVPSRRITWKATYRIIPTKYPPIALFERVAPQADWEMLYQLEGMTNPRLRHEAGNVSLVPANKRVTGDGATPVMAPFTHCSTSRPSRFTDGTFGIYYAGHTFKTALLEVAFHMGRFHASTADPPMRESYRTYKGAINKVMHDIRGGSFSEMLSPSVDDYAKPQAFAKVLRNADSNGIVYPSVRHVGGECIAAFWPNVVSIPTQERHIELKWDGTTMVTWHEYKTDKANGPPKWLPLPKK